PLVRDVARVGELVGLDLEETRVKLARDATRGLELEGREAGRDGGEGDDAIRAGGLDRRVEEDGAVEAAREGDGQPLFTAARQKNDEPVPGDAGRRGDVERGKSRRHQLLFPPSAVSASGGGE